MTTSAHPTQTVQEAKVWSSGVNRTLNSEQWTVDSVPCFFKKTKQTSIERKHQVNIEITTRDSEHACLQKLAATLWPNGLAVEVETFTGSSESAISDIILRLIFLGHLHTVFHVFSFAL